MDHWDLVRAIPAMFPGHVERVPTMRVANPRIARIAVVCSLAALLGGSLGWARQSAPSGVCGETGAIPMDAEVSDLDGTPRRLSDLAGRALLIHVWSTFFRPALAQLPVVRDIHSRFGDQGLAVVGLAGDDTPEAIRQSAAEFRIRYLLVLPGSDRRLRAVLGRAGVGRLWLAWPDGRVCGQYSDSQDWPRLTRDVQFLLRDRAGK
jgi:hypothetical protein